MKNRVFILAAASVIAAASCSKEAQTPVAALKTAVMTAEVPSSMTKLAIDGTSISWEAGDALSCRWASGVTYTTDKTSCETITAIGSGNAFTGDVANVGTPQNFYVFRLGGATFSGTGASQISQTVSNTQTGTLQYIKDNAAFYLFQKKANITLNENTYSFSGTLNPFFGVVKINVPSSLGVTAIKMEADSYIAGDYIINAARTYGTIRGIESSYFLDRYNKTNNYNSITVSNSGAVYDGDVYFLVVPDAYDSTAKEYYCSTDNLTFTFTTSSGDITFSSKLNGKIYCRSLKNLGNVPATIKPTVNPGKLCLLSSATPCVSVTGSADNCEFYYETGDALEDVAKPTTSSASFDAAAGVEIAYAQEYTNKYIKVLVHDTTGASSDAVICGNVRQWHVGKGEVYTELGKVKAGTSLTTSDNNKYILTTNNLCIARRATTDMTSDTNFEYGTVSQKMANAIVFMPVVENSTDNLYVYMRVHSTTSVGETKSRGYNLVYPKSYNDGTLSTTGYNRVNSYTNSHDSKSYATQTSVSGSLNAVVGISWNLGQATPGERFAITQDGKVAIYNVAILENL